MTYFVDLNNEGFPKGFYSDSLNSTIPETAIELSDADYELLSSGGRYFIDGKVSEVRPSDFHTWSGTAWVLNETAFTKAKQDHLAAYRYQRETAGLEIAGIAVRTDRETQAMLLAARTKAKEDSAYTLIWKAQNGFFTLDAAQIISLADAVHDHVQKCFTAEAAVDLALCESEQDVEDAFDTAYNA